ncbi:4-(cytidine 5'-diphospho)-2-C-methyl-D-erythritol kinase [Sphingomicrobium flavum]|uniref:4-(cytidine 5'-diphospho)-2-C-methyl-D-erythritol kinase n=1 Tax=Sphingomicrobium flavum TaxID=1229164 RepID=UPI0021ADBE2E|nr:4-(cytidine 5'-diphospho)-2-C-methyl-D-erythritol kinase [Sphingomicrobium flavum]
MRYSEPAPAKINLALHVRRRREDGRHDLETLFAFCTDGDLLHAEPADDLTLHVQGPFSSGLDGDNLVMAAAEALQRASGYGSAAKLTLEKKLPVASGLGGGSADAAAALRLLTRLWNVDPHFAQQVAPGLGADVPACLLSLTARGEGVGDQLTPIVLPDISGAPVLLVNPLKPLSTAAVFGAWDGQDRGPLDHWREGRNDLEAPARNIVPEIGELLAWLASRDGADLARMSGSGASCFALFESEAARDAAATACPDKWWHLASHLR